MLQDIRYAIRLMLRSRGFTAVAVVSLALGIGANTAIFSLLNTVMLRTLAVEHPERLVEFLQKYPTEPRGNGWWTRASYENFRDNNKTLSGLTGTSFDGQIRVRMEGASAETVSGEGVLGNYFEVLGIKPAMGRLINSGDRGGDAVVVSWSYWSSRLHRDPGIIGKHVLVNDAPMTVVGVVARGYDGPRAGSPTQIWTVRDKDGLALLGRLKPGATIEQSRAEMSVLYRFTIEERSAHTIDPQVRQMHVEVEPAGAGLAEVRDRIGKPLLFLMAVVGSLLLLACVNMASMLLARGAGRQKELAVRIAIGASRARLARQMISEAVLLSISGSMLGVVLAYFSTTVLLRIMASARLFERVEIQVRPDLHVLLFTAGLAMLTGVLFGLAPAWHASRLAPAMSLRQTGSGGDTPFWRWFGKGLVTAQVALSILLVTAAAVFLGHLSHLRSADLGFRADHVLLMILDPSNGGYSRDQLAGRYKELLERLDAIPGVRSASLCACSPIQGCGASRFVFAEGSQERPEDRRYIALSWVAPKYFETLGTPLVAGRDFSFRDAGGPRVAIISEEMARHYFPGGNPIGKHVTIDPDARTGGWQGTDPYEVIGVVADSKVIELRDPPHREMYFNMFQSGRMFNQFALRTSMSPWRVAGDAQRVARESMKGVAVGKVTTLTDQMDASIVAERLVATLSEFFGALGAVLAGIGLYGLLAYSVARRINEIGVRIALGATARDVRRLVLRDALTMVAAGTAVGIAIVMWARPLAASVLPGVRVDGGAVLAAGGVVLVTVAILASYVPARRAARVDPMAALRQD